ncbi:sushi, von Willebrand factor type A, EGF and pentraxin domain-containing protein 1-like isoform X2 [Heptranchias perlo]|uniref:sushi, von Willebrand factor type A, EGF and pentraxin domain-containing protein 1-like isoform X2 n=1 Tax=Heptranchias perlo TaxID=212740 RepID=UPI003559A7EC
MAERMVLALMTIGAVWVSHVTGDCGKPPQLENGSPTDKFVSWTSFPVGAKVVYRCYQGYVYKDGSSRHITCKEDSTWLPLRAICEPKSCGNPGEILNGYYEAPDSTFGSKVTFYCDRGYNMVGRAHRLCKADGWNGQVPTCESITCDDLPAIRNGRTPLPLDTEHWEYGMIAKYSCIGDYLLIGADKLVCTVTGKWDKDPPTCKVVRCHRPELIANGRIVAGFGPIYKYQETITFHCNEGYEMVGNSVIECSENNTFVPPPPTCRPFVRCHRPELIVNGRIVAGFGPTYKYRETITYRCNEGYEMIGNSVIECSEIDTFVPPPPTCRPFVRCHRPELIANGRIVAGFGPTYKYQEMITYRCNEGYQMVGNSVIECSENNTFVPPPPTCRSFVRCHRPELIVNGRIVAGFGPTYKHQETITYRCNEGYEMVGNSVIECSEINTFVPPPPTCRPFVRCHRPELIANGRIVAGFGPTYKYQEMITYRCNEGYQMVGNSVIECSENNTFVPPPPTCRSFVRCHRPELIVNGRIIAGFGPTYKHQETITYRCNEGYEMVGNSVIECSEINTFVPPPPTCRPFVRCHRPELIVNGRIVAGFGPTYKYQEMITYRCNEGYQMVGNSVIECSENNTFVPPPPTCRSFVRCHRPELIVNGRIVAGFGPTYKYRETITYRCNEGYEMIGNSVIECSEIDTFVPPPPTCRPFVRCHRPELIVNGRIVAGFGPTYKYRETITYRCNEGYEMVGNSVIECSEIDTFVPPPPTCRPSITCADLPPITNGRAPSPPYGEHWKYGMVAKYSCNDEYSLIGAKELVCTPTGQWNKDPPTCKAMNCGNPGEILNGYYETPNTTSNVIFYCEEGYQMVGRNYRLCTADGWDGQVPTCEFVGCHSPELLTNGRIVTGFGPTYKLQETITYSCNEGYEMVGRSVIECNENNTFVPPPPTCRPCSCGKLPQLENGSPRAELISRTSFDVGTEVTYSCYIGYTLKEGSSRSATCKIDTTWTPLQVICEPMNCANPGEILKGYYEAPNITVGNKVTFYCDEGYKMIGRDYRLCTADGWDDQVPSCESPGGLVKTIVGIILGIIAGLAVIFCGVCCYLKQFSNKGEYSFTSNISIQMVSHVDEASNCPI